MLLKILFLRFQNHHYHQSLQLKHFDYYQNILIYDFKSTSTKYTNDLGEISWLAPGIPIAIIGILIYSSILTIISFLIFRNREQRQSRVDGDTAW